MVGVYIGVICGVIAVVFFVVCWGCLAYRYCKKKGSKSPPSSKYDPERPSNGISTAAPGGPGWENKAFDRSQESNRISVISSVSLDSRGQPLRSSLKKKKQSRPDSNASGYSSDLTSSCDEDGVFGGVVDESQESSGSKNVRFAAHLPTVKGDVPPADGRPKQPKQTMQYWKSQQDKQRQQKELRAAAIKSVQKKHKHPFYPSFGGISKKLDQARGKTSSLPTTPDPGTYTQRSGSYRSSQPAQRQRSFEGHRPPMRGQNQVNFGPVGEQPKSFSVSALNSSSPPATLSENTTFHSDGNVPGVGYSNRVYQPDMDSSSSSMDGVTGVVDATRSQPIRRSKRRRSRRGVNTSQDSQILAGGSSSPPDANTINRPNAPAQLPQSSVEIHGYPVAQSSPQDHRYMDLFSAPSNSAETSKVWGPTPDKEQRPRMPQEYFPPQSPANGLQAAPTAAPRGPRKGKSASIALTPSSQQRSPQSSEDVKSSLDSNYHSASHVDSSDEQLARIKISMNPGGAEPKPAKKKKKRPRQRDAEQPKIPSVGLHENFAYIDDDVPESQPKPRKKKTRPVEGANASFGSNTSFTNVTINPDSEETEV